MHLKLLKFIFLRKVLNKKYFCIKKLPFFLPFRDDSCEDKLPKITLYSHRFCTLCDELEEELQNKFYGRYELEKVDITKKENIRFLRLYRYDIPVCFLHGQFLCMHRLNDQLLSRKLREIEDNSSK